MGQNRRAILSGQNWYLKKSLNVFSHSMIQEQDITGCV